MKNNKMGPRALASWVSTLSAVRSFFVDKLFNFSPLSLQLLLRAAHNYEVDCEQIHIFRALFIFYSGPFCVSLDLPSPSWMPDPILTSYFQSSQLPVCNQVLSVSSEIFSVHRGCVLQNSVMLPSVQGLSLKTTLSLLHSLTSSYFALLPAFVRGARSGIFFRIFQCIRPNFSRILQRMICWVEDTAIKWLAEPSLLDLFYIQLCVPSFIIENFHFSCFLLWCPF